MILLEFDSIIRAALSSISNVSLSDKSWKQVSLPNRFGGLGFRSARALSLPCFLSSSYASSSFVRLLLSSFPDALASDDLQGGDRDVVLARELWQKQCSVAPLDLLESQRKKDDLLCEVALNDLLVDAVSGSSAKSAELLKSRKYQGLVGNFHFQPVAFQTTGCCGPSTSSFVEELSRKIIEASGNPLEAVWLRQKISLTIVRGNAISILSCFHSPSSFSQV